MSVALFELCPPEYEGRSIIKDPQGIVSGREMSSESRLDQSQKFFGTLGTPKLRPGTSASGYRSGGGVGVGIGRGDTPSHISQQRCGVCQRQLRGSQPGVSVKDTELIPYQVRQGKRLNVT